MIRMTMRHDYFYAIRGYCPTKILHTEWISRSSAALRRAYLVEDNIRSSTTSGNGLISGKGGGNSTVMP